MFGYIFCYQALLNQLPDDPLDRGNWEGCNKLFYLEVVFVPECCASVDCNDMLSAASCNYRPVCECA